MAKTTNFSLQPDYRGMVWDLLLYIPTVGALLYIGVSLWYSADRNWSYVLLFMSCFFFFAGANRILGSRLMLLPTSPVGITAEKDQVVIKQRNGETLALVKEVRFFADYAGKSFGLTGLDYHGRKHQLVIHRGQFSAIKEFDELKSLLAVYK